MKLIVVKRFVMTSVSEVKVVVFRRQREWENMYVVSSPKYFNTSVINLPPHSVLTLRTA